MCRQGYQKNDERKAAVNECTARKGGPAGEQGLTTMKVFEALALRGSQQVRKARSALEAAAMFDIEDAVLSKEFSSHALVHCLEDMKTLRTRCSMPAITFDAKCRRGDVTPESVLEPLRNSRIHQVRSKICSPKRVGFWAKTTCSTFCRHTSRRRNASPSPRPSTSSTRRCRCATMDDTQMKTPTVATNRTW